MKKKPQYSITNSDFIKGFRTRKTLEEGESSIIKVKGFRSPVFEITIEIEWRIRVRSVVKHSFRTTKTEFLQKFYSKK